MWQVKPNRYASVDEHDPAFTKRSPRDWPLQETWLQRLYPDLLTWYQPMPWNTLRPGFGPVLYRFMMDYNVRHWVARSGGYPSAILSWQAMAGQNDRLWAAVPSEGSDQSLLALLRHARGELSWRQSLTLDFPAGEYKASIEEAGFYPHRTLLWMKLQTENPVSNL
jgi:hypothetical protein